MTTDKIRQLEYRFGLQRVQVKDPGISAQLWAFRHREGGQQLVTLCTVDAPQDFLITVFEPDLAAGAALLRVVLNRQDAHWEPGRVWLNDQPLLMETKIQGLVVGHGEWAPVFALTEQEAEIVARETVSAITITVGRNPVALCDLFRDNAFASPSDEDLASIKVYTSKLARQAPLRRIKAITATRFAAFTNEEPAGYLDDPDNFEVKFALELMPRIHGSRLFFAGATPGEQLTYGHGGWEYSVP